MSLLILHIAFLVEEAKYTAAFVEHMDQLFNALNSSSLTSIASMRHAITESSGHIDFLKSSFVWIKSIKTKGEQNMYKHIFLIVYRLVLDIAPLPLPVGCGCSIKA